MKKKLMLLICGLTFLVTGSLVYSQDNDSKSFFETVIGPRLGMTWIISDPEAFDSAIQSLYPNPSRTYFPLISQFGLNIEQRIRVGDTNHMLAFQEVLLFGGLEQNLILPSLSLLIGYRADFGFEIGVGPFLYLTADETGNKVIWSIVGAVGYTFSFGNVFIPIDIAFVPFPADGRPRLSLTTGFNFRLDRLTIYK